MYFQAFVKRFDEADGGGRQEIERGRGKKANELFSKSYDLWNIFWGLNLGLIEAKDLPAEEDEKEEIKLGEGKKVSVFTKLGDVIQKILDCCRE